MEANLMLLASLAEMVKIEMVIISCEKAGSSIVTTLDDVEQN